MKIDDKTEANTTELAVVIGVTGRRVQQLAQDGLFKAIGKGKYYLAEAVQKYIDLRVREKTMSQAEKSLQEAEVSLKKSKAIKAVLETKELQGKMHRSEDVLAVTEDLIYAIRGMLVALPGRLAIDVAGITDPAVVSEMIRKEVHIIMEELSRYQYDAKKYEEIVRNRLSWEKIDVGGDDE